MEQIISEDDARNLAIIIDHIGSIYLFEHGIPHCSITSTNRQSLSYYKKLAGEMGHIWPNHDGTHTWFLKGYHLRMVLISTKPYLTDKQQQAELVLLGTRGDTRASVYGRKFLFYPRKWYIKRRFSEQ